MAIKKEAAAVHLPDNLGKEKSKAAPQSRAARIKRFLKLLVIVGLLLCLVIGGFFLGIYLRIFDMNTINEKMELYKYPIIGSYFVKPVATETEPVTEAKKEGETGSKDRAGKIEDAKLDPEKLKDPSKPILLTKEEVEKQIKLRQAEEKKRVSKLARLYGQMKPQEAVAVMDSLDDDMTIAILQKMEEAQTAKVLATFDAEKAARLTKIMYSGRSPAAAQVP